MSTGFGRVTPPPPPLMKKCQNVYLWLIEFDLMCYTI